MPTFEEIEAELKATGTLSKTDHKGKTLTKGLTLTRTPGGAILRNVNKFGEPLRFNKTQIAYLTARFPELTDVLTRNMETMRRVQGLRARLTTFLGGSGLTKAAKAEDAKGLTDAQKAFLDKLPERKLAYFESLDPDPNRKLPASLADIKASSPETLPRAFTRVDMTDPEKPRVRCWRLPDRRSRDQLCRQRKGDG